MLTYFFSTAENVETWFDRLRQAEKELSSLITHKFDEAVKREDMASVDRFFKLFPLLNKHEEGLKKFTTYLCAKVRNWSSEILYLCKGNYLPTLSKYTCMRVPGTKYSVE